MPAPVSFPDFVNSLADLGRLAREDEEMRIRIHDVVTELRAIGTPTPESLAEFVKANPHSVPVLATCIGLTQEQLKNQLKHRLNTTGWIKLARERGPALIEMLDEFGLTALLTEQLNKDWTFSDVLLERYLWSRRGAANAVGQGRNVEDEVEAVVRELGIASQPRTRFNGRGPDSAPCDLAIPSGGTLAQVVIAMKAFQGTGSKLTDAVREIEQMAQVRLPTQYVYAVVDGIGWKSRQADLKRIHDLWETRRIDGLYTLAHLDRFRDDIVAAADRLGLLPVRPAEQAAVVAED